MVFHPGWIFCGSLDFEEDIGTFLLAMTAVLLSHKHRTFHGGFCRLYTNTSQAWAPFSASGPLHMLVPLPGACSSTYYILVPSGWISVHILRKPSPKHTRSLRMSAIGLFQKSVSTTGRGLGPETTYFSAISICAGGATRAVRTGFQEK